MAEQTPSAVFGVTSAQFESTGAEGLKCRMLRFLGNTEEPFMTHEHFYDDYSTGPDVRTQDC